MNQLKEGMKAPPFEGRDQNGQLIRLSDYKGKKLVLFFYPKDNTPGCTSEACNLRDNHDTLLKEGFAVVGVSMDTEKSHKSFAEKHSLPFPLIADTSKKYLMIMESGDRRAFTVKHLWAQSGLHSLLMKKGL